MEYKMNKFTKLAMVLSGRRTLIGDIISVKQPNRLDMNSVGEIIDLKIQSGNQINIQRSIMGIGYNQGSIDLKNVRDDGHIYVNELRKESRNRTIDSYKQFLLNNSKDESNNIVIANKLPPNLIKG